MTRHAYALSTLWPDYLRGAGGFGAAAAAAFFLHPATVAFWLFLVLAALFLGFAFRTASRQIAAIEVGADGLSRRGVFPVTIFWGEIRGLDLRYYSIRRDRSEGWMQLTVRGRNYRRIVVDDRIAGFRALAERLAAEAAAKGVGLSERSLANLKACTAPPAASGKRAERRPEQ